VGRQFQSGGNGSQRGRSGDYKRGVLRSARGSGDWFRLCIVAR
jgi:hypothetical protein